ncbi:MULTISPECIES: glycosyltransferase family 2 protein [unclassified Microcoleus]|uniref:glycosyltransferase family 2 protein n=1 Tax=unclassified Microcoleus TaxID=2642155 RepID=UPI002FD47591
MPDYLVLGVWLIVLAASVPLLTFCLEVVLGLSKPRTSSDLAAQGTTCIIMPAHDEAVGIGEALDKLIAALPEAARILVVADNCSDNTAELARACGVNVVERDDPARRGKGFALACGRDWLKKLPPDCVIVLDADCYSDRDSLVALTGAALRHQLPVQASYSFEPDLNAAPKVQISNFAFWVKNVVRQKGSHRMGGAAVLTGTGMAFPWELFEKLDLATGNITEDLALAVDLALCGRASLFLEDARVLSKAASVDATLAQRSRWEHGFLSMAQRYSMPLLLKGLLLVDKRIFLLGLHLLVPPLVLLLTIAAALVMLLVCFALWSNLAMPTAILSGMMIATMLCVLAAWFGGGRTHLSAGALMMVPLYVIWKIPVYVRFLSGKRSGWVRTDRTST